MNKTGTEIVVVLVGVMLVMPIWFYLLYKILKGVGASELMWFLFWVYVPLSYFSAIATQLLEKE